MPPPPEPQATFTAGSAAWSFFTGLGAAAVPLAVMWVKLQLDQLSARCDAFAKVVEGAMDLALEYWLLGVPAGATPHPADSEAGKNQSASIAKHEIRLRAAQTALQADVERMAGDLPPGFHSALRAEFQSLIHAMTGDPFGDRTGHSEPEKAQAAVSSGTRLIRVVREGRDDTSGVLNLLRFVTGATARRRKFSALGRRIKFYIQDLSPCILFVIAIAVPTSPLANYSVSCGGIIVREGLAETVETS